MGLKRREKKTRRADRRAVPLSALFFESLNCYTTQQNIKIGAALYTSRFADARRTSPRPSFQYIRCAPRKQGVVVLFQKDVLTALYTVDWTRQVLALAALRALVPLEYYAIKDETERRRAFSASASAVSE